MSGYIPIIPIEDLIKVSFTPISLKGDIPTKREIKNKLVKACKNGNTSKSKYMITFTTSNGWLKVESTIWMVGDEFVLLKNNIHIPFESIVDIT